VLVAKEEMFYPFENSSEHRVLGGEYCKMGFFKVASTKDLRSGEMKGAEAGGKPVLIVNLAGNYYALGNVCTHEGCMLSDGVLDGEKVQCPCHGSVFNVKTGSVVNGPAMKPEPAFQVKVEGDQIMVSV